MQKKEESLHQIDEQELNKKKKKNKHDLKITEETKKVRHELIGRLKLPLIGIGLIATTIGGIYIFKSFSQRDKEFENTTFEKNLDNVSKDTLLDEILEARDDNTLEKVTAVERLLKASNTIEELDLDKYDLKKIDEDYKSVTIDEIEEDVARIKEMNKRVENKEINLNLPTPESKEFYKLVQKIKYIDSKACNYLLTNRSQELKDVYFDLISAKFLDCSKINNEDINEEIDNITYYSSGTKEKVPAGLADVEIKENESYLIYDEPNGAHEYVYRIDSGRGAFLDKSYDRLLNMGDLITEPAYKYSKARNDIIQDSLTHLKKLLYYKLDENDSIISIIMSRDEVLSGSFDKKLYQKVKAK